MLTREVRFEGFTVPDWLRLLSLFERPEPPAHDGGEAPKPEGGLVVIHDEKRVRKLLHTRVGRLDIAGERWPSPLDELCKRHHAAWGVAFSYGALDEVMERFGARAQRSDDIARQALGLAHIVREMAAEQAIVATPYRLAKMPLPSHAVIARTLESLCPTGRSIALGLFDGGELWTALALGRGAGGVDLILGPEELRGEMGLLSGDWRRDYRHLVRAVERRSAPLAAGLFTEVKTLRRLWGERRPGAWARAAGVRDIIVSPVSFAVGLPLVIDAARGGYRAARGAAERFDPTGTVAPLLRALTRSRGGEPAEGAEGPKARPLGALDLLRALLGRGP